MDLIEMERNDPDGFVRVGRDKDKGARDSPAPPVVGTDVFSVWAAYYRATSKRITVASVRSTAPFTPPLAPVFGVPEDITFEEHCGMWCSYYDAYVLYCNVYYDKAAAIAYGFEVDFEGDGFLSVRCGSGNGYCYMDLVVSDHLEDARVLGSFPSLSAILACPAEWFGGWEGVVALVTGHGVCHISRQDTKCGLSVGRLFNYAAALQQEWAPGSWGAELVLGHLGRLYIQRGTLGTTVCGDLVVLEHRPTSLPETAAVVARSQVELDRLALAYPGCKYSLVDDTLWFEDVVYFAGEDEPDPIQSYKLARMARRSLIYCLDSTSEVPYGVKHRSLSMSAYFVMEEKGFGRLVLGGNESSRERPHQSVSSEEVFRPPRDYQCSTECHNYNRRGCGCTCRGRLHLCECHYNRLFARASDIDEDNSVFTFARDQDVIHLSGRSPYQTYDHHFPLLRGLDEDCFCEDAFIVCMDEHTRARVSLARPYHARHLLLPSQISTQFPVSSIVYLVAWDGFTARHVTGMCAVALWAPGSRMVCVEPG